MATRVQTTQVSTQSIPVSSCDYCHQKQKCQNYDYCSKTCAGQALAKLCTHCHKKPKHPNFDFCGRTCATLTNPQNRKPVTNSGQSQATTAPKSQNYPKGKNFNVQPQSQHTQPAIDPMQIAKLIVQQLPQVQALLAGTSVSPASTLPVAGAPAAQAVPVTQTKNPFLGGQHNVQSASNSGTLPSTQQLHISTQPAAGSTACIIPGCQQPVHVDAVSGTRTSDYCSMKHREEAVKSGLVSPCIMCLTLPQSDTDYFCGKACREDANNKV